MVSEMLKIECPKCNAKLTWFESTEHDLIHRCQCGYRRIILTTYEDVEILHKDAGEDVKLPSVGTKLWQTLSVLSVERVATSGELTTRINKMGEEFTVSEVSSYLTMLRARGLVETLVVRRGFAGGSTWQLTSIAKRLLKIKE